MIFESDLMGHVICCLIFHYSFVYIFNNSFLFSYTSAIYFATNFLRSVFGTGCTHYMDCLSKSTKMANNKSKQNEQ